MNAVIALITAGIGSKLSGKFSDKITAKVTAQMSKKFGITSNYLRVFVQSAVTAPSAEAIKSASEESLNLVKKRIKSGKPLTSTDLIDSFTNVLVSSLTAGLNAKLGDLAGETTKQLEKELSGKIMLESLRKILKGDSKKVFGSSYRHRSVFRRAVVKVPRFRTRRQI